MTVKQLKEELSKYPDDMQVFMDERITDFTYGLVNSLQSKKIDFMEEPDGKVLSSDEVVIVSEY